jgi:hypothetical protein
MVYVYSDAKDENSPIEQQTKGDANIGKSTHLTETTQESSLIYRHITHAYTRTQQSRIKSNTKEYLEYLETIEF